VAKNGAAPILIAAMGGSKRVPGADLRTRFEETALPLLGSLYGAAVRLTDRERAADLVQDTCLRAYRTFANFTPGTNAKAWLFTIMYSVFVNSYRKGRREPPVVSLDELEARFDRTLDVPDATAHVEILRNPELDWKGSEAERALQRLPEEFRAAVLLVDVEELTYEEAAQVAACPLGTLRSRLFRGRKMLWLELQDYARKRGYVKGGREGK
jgi:RNA polymerase sigma-70 factor, ECF subfamily